MLQKGVFDIRYTYQIKYCILNEHDFNFFMTKIEEDLQQCIPMKCW
jgi:hypothetical protein